MGFKDIIGHDTPKNLLRMFLENKNIPHAFLFSGQEGIGKKHIAKAFASIFSARPLPPAARVAPV
jgi:DNA polymerase-3 subunit delta'